MDLSSATPSQMNIISTLDAPLSVAAGAGSGKTFTLTNRIGFALLGNDVTPPYIDTIDEILAITFSRTGAEEMKSRIRTLLQEEGLEEEARKVEDAWISTIHGMCARILREHALELGVDPDFEVVDDTVAKELWQRALNMGLERLREETEDPRLVRMFSWYPETGGKSRSGLSDLLTMVREKTLGLPRGFESVVIPTSSFDPMKALSCAIENARAIVQDSLGWKSIGATQQKQLDAIEGALDGARAFEQHCDHSQPKLDDPTFDLAAYLDVLLAFPVLKPGRIKDPLYRDAVDRYMQVYAQIGVDAVHAAASVVTTDLMRLVRLIDEEYQRLKSANKLDNADLLRKCAQVLDDNPDLRASYQSRFKLIMVDEFQDTDLLQVSIINSLSTNNGSNVMTVGDAQQGIYRFRGADVEVFYRHRDMQRRAHENFQSVSLPDNFRSHGDVLAFVDSIFSRPDFFGDEFLSLKPSGPVHTTPDPLFDELPRVEVHVFESRSRHSSTEDARRRSAQAIAARFSELRDKGVPASKMAILLWSLNNVQIYTDALSSAGFESVIAGGSVFAGAHEVQLTSCLLSCVADKGNSSALYTVLSSELFNLDDASFLAIGRFDPPDEALPRRSSFANRFWYLASVFDREGEEVALHLLADFSLSDAASAELLRVLRLMNTFDKGSQRLQPAAALRKLFGDSGWLYRLQESGAEGLSVAANLFKAISLVCDRERQHLSLVQIARDFGAFLSVTKEKPGTLATLDADFVKIMTIHASKGLEFDHVAVADFALGTSEAEKLSIDTFGDATLLSLAPAIRGENARSNGKALENYIDRGEIEIAQDANLQDLDASQFAAFLSARIEQGTLGDAQRLLYVALTRAARSLCLCINFQGNTNFAYEGKGLIDPLSEVLEWPREEGFSRTHVDYGGSALALVEHEVLLERMDASPDFSSEKEVFTIVEQEQVALEPAQIEGVRHDVVSYSSIAPSHHGLPISDDVDEMLESDLVAGEESGFLDDAAAQVKHLNAVALGSAFHLLAQRAIESRTKQGIVPEFSYEALDALAQREDLSLDQIARLRQACERWFGSELCKRFFSASRIFAEVPFMLKIEGAEDAIGKRIFLEGEIDGLAVEEQGEDHAFFIDYKTGGSSEEAEEMLYEKHLLQAQCYALALLRQGFATVEANFIRVEQCDLKNPDQPQVVTYTFKRDQISEFEETVLEAYRVGEQDKQ